VVSQVRALRVKDVAAYLRVSHQRGTQMYAEGKLPEPEWEDGIGPLWKSATIERWAKRGVVGHAAVEETAHRLPILNSRVPGGLVRCGPIPVAWTVGARVTGRPFDLSGRAAPTVPQFGITVRGPPTFFLEGELDIATVPVMNAAIAVAVAQGGPITLDLSRVTSIDSSGVGAILKGLKGLPSGGCINLHGVHSRIEKVMRLLMGAVQAENLHVSPCSVPVDRPA
jgi:anti-anti-sigma factor